MVLALDDEVVIEGLGHGVVLVVGDLALAREHLAQLTHRERTAQAEVARPQLVEIEIAEREPGAERRARVHGAIGR